MKRYRMRIQILSPVHIGSGREIDPLEYVIKEVSGHYYFYMLDTTGFLQDLSPTLRADFDTAVNNPDPVYLRSFFTKNVDPQKYSLFVSAAEDAFVRAYQDNLENPRNQLLVNLMIRLGGDYLPFLPGSSIKGAIRTAVVSCIADEKNVRFSNPWKFENDVLGHSDGKQDPFRCIKIADAVLPENATFIDYVEIFKPDAGPGPDPRGIQMFYEQCYSLLDKEDVVATTTLDIDDQLPEKSAYDRRNRRDSPAVSMPITADQIVDSCRKFYLPKIQAEHNNFYASSQELSDANGPLLEVSFADNEFPIRLGRFSHIECTTVDGFRKPGGAASRRGFGKTRTLSAGLMAMGWVKVTLKLLA